MEWKYLKMEIMFRWEEFKEEIRPIMELFFLPIIIPMFLVGIVLMIFYPCEKSTTKIQKKPKNIAKMTRFKLWKFD